MTSLIVEHLNSICMFNIEYMVYKAQFYLSTQRKTKNTNIDVWVISLMLKASLCATILCSHMVYFLINVLQHTYALKANGKTCQGQDYTIKKLLY